MIFFKSVRYIQVIPTNSIDIKQIKMIKFAVYLDTMKLHKRTNPTPPNFNKIPAKIIDPYTGASTCARGNHK